MDYCFTADAAQSANIAEAVPRTGFSLSTSPWTSDNLSSGEQPILELPDLRASTPLDIHASTSALEKASTSRMARLIDHLPLAENSALDTFELLENNLLYHKSLGCSHQSLDTMICDCQYDPCSDEVHVACGTGSQCINRLTQVECLANECPTRNACQNQRFQRKQYAHIEIVKTERKGFGLRAASHIGSDDFVYEYVGEVIPEDIFRLRIKEYADEGIEHFYFMMLQKGEYIDATKRGGTARFLNHSCEPNCYVAKWVVGRRMRMGIFAKREIMRGEELTFNYNVDRYGYDPQPCYCGELNCSGTIGGKTQTDLRLMDPLYLEAMGHRGEDSNKASRRRKELTVDDFQLDDLHPLHLTDAQKFVAAMRQAVNQGHRDIVIRLLHRVKITPTAEVDWDMIMNDHGLIIWRQTLDMLNPTVADDDQILRLVFQVLDKWQPTRRNRVESTGLLSQIQELVSRLSGSNLSIAGNLVERWTALPLKYTIPRKEISTEKIPHRPIAEDDKIFEPRWKEEERAIEFQLAPVVRANYPFRPSIREDSANSVRIQGPSTADERAELESILAGAGKDTEPELEAKTDDQVSTRLTARDIERLERKRKRSKLSPVEEKDLRLKTLVSELVKQRLSIQKAPIDRETYKKYARECTDLVVQKEKRSETYASSPYDSLSSDKKKKMKVFIDGYVSRLIKKLRERGKLQIRSDRLDTPSNSASYSPQMDGNNSHDDMLTTVCLSGFTVGNAGDEVLSIDCRENSVRHAAAQSDVCGFRQSISNDPPHHQNNR